LYRGFKANNRKFNCKQQEKHQLRKINNSIILSKKAIFLIIAFFLSDGSINDFNQNDKFILLLLKK